MIDLPHIPPNKTRYGGMTVNERLSTAGLLEKFDRAARKRDRDSMIALLSEVELADHAPSITDTILANAAKYGY
jgi:hypothetical protein